MIECMLERDVSCFTMINVNFKAVLIKAQFVFSTVDTRRKSLIDMYQIREDLITSVLKH